MVTSTLVDVEALWHVALYSLVASVGVVAAYGTLVIALDRSDRSRASAGSRGAWLAVVALMGCVCLGIVALGLWAMTQK